MNKRVICLFIIICIMILPACTIKNNSKIEADNFTTAQVYIVKEFKGKIAVFQQGNDLPVHILDCIIKDLPPDAVQALTTGIEVNNINELQKIIEAYD